MREMSKIAFAGDAAGDMSVYLAGILAAMNEKVLVIDAYSERKISYLLDLPEGIDVTRDVAQYRRFDYTQSGCVPVGGYSAVITLCGNEIPAEDSDLVAVVVNESDDTFYNLAENEYPEYKESILIVRESFGLANREFKAFAKASHIKDVEHMKPSKQDSAGRLFLKTAHEIRVGSVSEQMRDLLFSMISVIREDITEKEFLKAVKAVRKGGTV